MRRRYSIFAPMMVGLVFAVPGPLVAQSFTPPKLYTVSPTGVNLLDGAYTYSNTDLSVGPLKLERSHLGGPETSDAYFGPTWTHNWDMQVEVKLTGTVNVNTTVVLGRTKYHYLGQPSTGTAPDNDAVGTTIAGNLFTDRDGTKYTFGSGSGGTSGVNHIVKIEHPDGSTEDISYVNSVPKLIVSNKGYAIVLDSNGAGQVTAACGFNLTQGVVTTSTTCAGAALKTSYTYNGNGTLATFTDVLGNLTTISYAATPAVAVTCITLPASSTCPVTNIYNTLSGRTQQVASQTMADGSTWQFTTTAVYLSRQDSDPDNTGYAATMTAPDTGVTHFGFNGVGLIGYTDPNSRTTVQTYAGDGSSTLVSATLPEGNKVHFLLNSQKVDAGNTWSAKPGSGLTDINEGIKTFPSTCTNRITCNEPLTVTDAKGSVTNFTYDQTHGGVLTKTSPADGAGINAVVRYAYVQRYAWISNGSGYIHASVPVWLLAEERTCRTSATVGSACAAGASDEVVTTYDYGPDSGPNNLLLRGQVVTADGTSRRTCYGYDWRGNRIFETKPRAGLAVCQ